MHPVALSYRAPHDFPRRDQLPSAQYMVATSPRSGSTYLALLLWRSGVMGAPMEYLNFDNSGNILHRLGDGDVQKYWDEVRRVRTSTNGIFGYKMFLANYQQTLARFPELVASLSADKVIFLRREDKVAQAVSHLRAIQSGIWFAGAKGKGEEPTYDFTQLLRCYRLAHRQDRQWENIFELTQACPIRLTYEELVTAPKQVLDRICGAFDEVFDAHNFLRHVPITRSQADEMSEEWKARFVADLADAETSQALNREESAA